MKRLRSICNCLFLVGIMVTVSGCWDVSPIEDRAIGLMVGLDKVGTRYRIGIQIPTLDNLAQTNSPNHTKGTTIFQTFWAEGSSLLSMVQRIEDENYRSFVGGSVKVIVVSKTIGADGIARLLGSFLRHPMVSPQTLILLTDQKVADILNHQPVLKLQPALTIVKQMASPLKRSRTYPMELWEFIARMDNQSPDPYLPIIRLDPQNKNYILEGLALFKGQKLVGKLDSEESYIFGAVTSGAERGLVNIQVGREKVGFSMLSHRAKVKVITANHRKLLEVQLNVKGILLDIPPDFPDQQIVLEKIKKAAEKQYRIQVKNLIHKLQQLDTDPVGFGRKLELAGDRCWRDAYRTVPVKVVARVNIRYSPPFR